MNENANPDDTYKELFVTGAEIIDKAATPRPRQAEIGVVTPGELVPLHGAWFRVASADQEEVEPGKFRTVVVMIAEGVTTGWLKRQKRQPGRDSRTYPH